MESTIRISLLWYPEACEQSCIIDKSRLVPNKQARDQTENVQKMKQGENKSDSSNAHVLLSR